jgi:polyhydroxybutyrate depolymerase
VKRIARGGLVVLCVLLVLGWAIFPVMPEPPPLRGAFVPGRLRVDDLERHFEAYVPPESPASPPLLFAIHGSGMDGAGLRDWTGSRFAVLADRDGFLVVYPDGYEREWNGCRAPGVTLADRRNLDDVGFHLALIDRFAESHGIDRTRVYAAGLSNGGQMAYRLASDVPERFAAVAAVVANLPGPDNTKCSEPRGAIPVLIMNGRADPIVPYEGGIASLFGWSARGQVLSALESARHWSRVNGIATPPVATLLPDADPEDGSRVNVQTWQGSGGAEVVLYTIEAGGHAIPGGVRLGSPWLTAPLFGRTNRDVRGADEIWDFLRRHRRTPAPPGTRPSSRNLTSTGMRRELSSVR